MKEINGIYIGDSLYRKIINDWEFLYNIKYGINEDEYYSEPIYKITGLRAIEYKIISGKVFGALIRDLINKLKDGGILVQVNDIMRIVDLIKKETKYDKMNMNYLLALIHKKCNINYQKVGDNIKFYYG